MLNKKLEKSCRTSGYYNDNGIKSKLKRNLYKIKNIKLIKYYYNFLHYLTIQLNNLYKYMLFMRKENCYANYVNTNLLTNFIDNSLNLKNNNKKKNYTRKNELNKLLKLNLIITSIFVLIISENICVINASAMMFKSSTIDLNNNDYNDIDENNNNNNNGILTSFVSATEEKSETPRIEFELEKNVEKHSNNEKTLDHPENSQVIFESTKLRHFANGNTNEHYYGKHDSRRKFRSTGNNTVTKSNNSLPHLTLTEENKLKINNSDLTTAATNNQPQQSVQGFRIEGFRIEHSSREAKFGDDGIPEILNGFDTVLRLFGYGLNDGVMIIFTSEENNYGGACLLPSTVVFRVTKGSVSADGKTALVNIVFDKGPSNKEFLICAKLDEPDENTQNVTIVKPFVHQGSESWLRIRSCEKLLPFWASIVIVVVCLIFSALFSGLNLGLMALDRTELKILRNTGTEKEREYASKIQPVRDHGNFLLCSILLGNVLVNSMFTILLDDLTSGVVAVICSTLAIVVFGEITPQAICSRHGLAVGAKTIYVTKAVMIITFPLSYPTSKILDYLLGEEIGNVYNRERLKELVRVTNDVNDLDKNEVNIISGALELRKKTVKDVMTHIEDAFMLSLDSILDFETVSEIMKSGFSRIPVYDSDRTNIVTLLYIKDLAFVDPDDNTPLKTLCEFYQNACHFVFEDVTLDIMFNQFKEGNKGHMAFVHRVNSEGDGDPFYETIGLVTLEDVIEELIQAEIIDETDVFIDNRTKRKRQKTQKQDFTIFAERRENQRIRISPQLTLATFQYLSTSVDPFKKDTVSETILRRLLNQDIIKHIKCKGKEKDDLSLLIFEQGKAVDFFVLILEGRVEVTVGRESLVFESGPFTYFGTQALVPNIGIESPSQQSQQQIMGSLQSLNMDALLRHSFVPDYSVRAVSDVIYIAIKRSLYLAAKRATLLERTQRSGHSIESSNEVIDDEVEKLLHSLDENDRYNAHHHIIEKPDLNDSDNNLSNMNLNDISTNTNNDINSKLGSKTPSPTFPSVSIINLVRKKNQEGQKNDLIMYATKDCLPNGPASPNSFNQTSFNQHTRSCFGMEDEESDKQLKKQNNSKTVLTKSQSGAAGFITTGDDSSRVLPSLHLPNINNQISKYNDNNAHSIFGNRRSIGEIQYSYGGIGDNEQQSAIKQTADIMNRRKTSNCSNNNLNNNSPSSSSSGNNYNKNQQKINLTQQQSSTNIDSKNSVEIPLLNDENYINQQQQQQQNNTIKNKTSNC